MSDLDKLLSALLNTNMAMLTLLKQLHKELNHPQFGCEFCKQYTDLSEANRQLFISIKSLKVE